MQLFSVPPYAPPPPLEAALPVSTQLDTTAFVDSHNTPPPLCSRRLSPVLRVAPLVRVKPTSAAPLVRYTHRIALSPVVVPGTWEPRITVTAAPLTLCTVTALSTATRFVIAPNTTRPPVSYTPLVTSTSAPAKEAASTASWILLAAVAQLV